MDRADLNLGLGARYKPVQAAFKFGTRDLIRYVVIK